MNADEEKRLRKKQGFGSGRRATAVGRPACPEPAEGSWPSLDGQECPSYIAVVTGSLWPRKRSFASGRRAAAVGRPACPEPAEGSWPSLDGQECPSYASPRNSTHPPRFSRLSDRRPLRVHPRSSAFIRVCPRPIPSRGHQPSPPHSSPSLRRKSTSARVSGCFSDLAANVIRQ